MRFSVLSIQQRGHLASRPLAYTQALATVFHVLGTSLGVLTIEQAQQKTLVGRQTRLLVPTGNGGHRQEVYSPPGSSTGSFHGSTLP